MSALNPHEKLRVVLRTYATGAKKGALAKEVGISRPTLDAWIAMLEGSADLIFSWGGAGERFRSDQVIIKKMRSQILDLRRLLDQNGIAIQAVDRDDETDLDEEANDDGTVGELVDPPVEGNCEQRTAGD